MQYNILHFLLENSSGKSSYAIVKYGNKEHAVFFANHHSMDYGEGFIEEPCYLHKIYFGQDLDKFCRHYAEDAIGPHNKEAIDKFIEERVLPYIRKDAFCLIDTPSVEPFLPDEIEEIKLISKSECIDWLLEHENIQ
jgi:hypothetical protein